MLRIVQDRPEFVLPVARLFQIAYKKNGSVETLPYRIKNKM